MYHSKPWFTKILLIGLNLLILIGCQPDESSTASVQLPTEDITTRSEMPLYDNPFAYCQAKQTLDQPEADYIGASLPDSINNTLQQILTTANQLPTVWDSQLVHWRCMAGGVYACIDPGPHSCDIRFDFSRKPTFQMQRYCQDHPNTIKIPKTSIPITSPYAWMCDGTMPTPKSQNVSTDQAGFDITIWQLIPSSEKS